MLQNKRFSLIVKPLRVRIRDEAFRNIPKFYDIIKMFIFPTIWHGCWKYW